MVAAEGAGYARGVATVELVSGSTALLSVGAAAGVGLGWWGPAPAVVASAAGLSGLTALLTVAAARPELQMFGPAILRSEQGRPEVALTFDDGPDPASTHQLLDQLDAHGARATFFLLADRARRWPDLVQRIVDRHEIGVHGASHHPWLTIRSPNRGAAELRGAARLLTELSGQPVRWFRPPFGVTSPRLHLAVPRAGLQTVWGSLRPRDGGPLSPQVLRQRCAAAVAGDILILHEGPRAARDALPDILDDLDARGLRSTTVGQLLADADIA